MKYLKEAIPNSKIVFDLPDLPDLTNRLNHSGLYTFLKSIDAKRTYEIINDYVFKEIYGREKFKNITKDLLTNFFKYTNNFEEEENMKVLEEVTLEKNKVLAKSIRCDVVIDYNEELVVNLEAYKVFNKTNVKKSLMYVARLYGNE